MWERDPFLFVLLLPIFQFPFVSQEHFTFEKKKTLQLNLFSTQQKDSPFTLSLENPLTEKQNTRDKIFRIEFSK
jgi:hypothetical protein